MSSSSVPPSPKTQSISALSSTQAPSPRTSQSNKRVPSKVWEQLKHYQENLIYLPLTPPDSRTVVQTPDQHEMPHYVPITLQTPDEVKLAAYYIPHISDGKLSPYTLLYCHGNAGNIGQRLPIAKILHLGCKLNVFMLEYRGFGRSEGRADEKGLKIDSQTALDWIFAKEELRHTKVILYGQSMGGAVVIDLASRNPGKITAVIVENTFLSLPKLMPHVSPLLRMASFLLHQIWDSETAITQIDIEVPILLLSGGKDDVIPQQHMLGLLKTVREARYTAFTKGLGFDAGNSGNDPTPGRLIRRQSDSMIDVEESTRGSNSSLHEKKPVRPSLLLNSGRGKKGLVQLLLKRNANKPNPVDVELATNAGRSVKNVYGVYWAEFPNGGHGSTCTETGYFEAIQNFLRAVL
ncbi:hypothetical protein HDU79_002700 [Rhizoclosmatium sp. JEL0117]|nr:hypothetical protein HDU79_002700 [Rhizoclosmatium sp. JEL0117]